MPFLERACQPAPYYAARVLASLFKPIHHCSVSPCSDAVALMVVFPPLLASAIWKAGRWVISLSVIRANRRVSCGRGLPGWVSKRARQRFFNERAGSGRPASKQRRLEDEWCCSTERRKHPFARFSGEPGMDLWKVQSLGRVEKEATGFQAVRSGSLRLPGERAASRANNLPGWELSTALRDMRFRVPTSWAPFLTSPLSQLCNLGHITHLP